jgi:hypothetical protein
MVGYYVITHLQNIPNPDNGIKFFFLNVLTQTPKQNVVQFKVKPDRKDTLPFEAVSYIDAVYEVWLKSGECSLTSCILTVKTGLFTVEVPSVTLK